jgi:hypothetical protein
MSDAMPFTDEAIGQAIVECPQRTKAGKPKNTWDVECVKNFSVVLRIAG